MAIVTVAEYRTITGDNASPSSAVSAKLDAAEDLIEEYLQLLIHFFHPATFGSG